MADTNPTLEAKSNGKAANPEYVPGTPRQRRKGSGKRSRRVFTAEYKARILAEIAALEASGEGLSGEVLRREGLYSSNIAKWRRQRDQGTLQALGQARGRKPDPDAAPHRELERLRSENERLQNRLKTAEAIIDIQKKLCEMLGLPVAPPNGRLG